MPGALAVRCAVAYGSRRQRKMPVGEPGRYVIHGHMGRGPGGLLLQAVERAGKRAVMDGIGGGTVAGRLGI